MARSRRSSILKTDRRIRLGIWGLGRGLSFVKACRALNLDVVAGCDFAGHLRQRFRQGVPDALVTDDADEFLDSDIDAVLVATYCNTHAADAIRCLEAGKHVLSEVTAFHTMAEGAALVETVERTGLVYNLAENYPFSKGNLYLAARWNEGLFGDLMYAECEYVHEIRRLCYTCPDGAPVQPGWTVHHWRSWQSFHYYCTHSLGPVMHITNLRPVRVVSLPGKAKLPGYLGADGMDSMGGIAPSLVAMSNGGLVRNLMGATTSDAGLMRLWGTRGAAEQSPAGLFLHLGSATIAPKLRVEPNWPQLGEWADRMGHGGGDFWVLYEFARHVLGGEPAFFDVYRAADCTIPGILAMRSAVENGRAYDVPSLRSKQDRDLWRDDNWAQKPYDVLGGVFPAGADRSVTGKFTAVMAELIDCATLCRAVQDWVAVSRETAEPDKALEVFGKFRTRRKAISQAVGRARRIIRACPDSDGAKVLREMIELAEPGKALGVSFARRLRAATARLRRRMKSAPPGRRA